MNKDNKELLNIRSLRKRVDDLIGELSKELEDIKATPDVLKAQDNERRKPLFKLNRKSKALIIAFIVLSISSFLFLNVNKIKGTARVIPSETVIVNAKVAGVLKELNYKEGDKVEKGTQICRLYNEEIETQLKLAEHELESANQRMAQLQERMAWLKTLVKNNESKSTEATTAEQKSPLTKEEPPTLTYNYALHEYNIKKEELESFNAKINYLKNTIEQLKIFSPISGTVISKIENKRGAFIKEGEEICEIADTSDMLLELPLKEEDISKIIPGQKALIRFSAYPQRKIPGFVLKTGYSAWGEQGRNWPAPNLVNVIVKPKELPPGIKIGMTAKVIIYLFRNKTMMSGYLK